VNRAQLARCLADRARDRRAGEFSAEALCSPAQLPLVRSHAKRKVARCSRRAGKTVGEAIMLLEGAVSPPFANQGYITLSLKNAKRLIWPTLKRLNAEYNLGGVPHEEGTLRFPSLPQQPNIYLGGVKDRGEIEKIRGWEGGAKRFVIDEAQSIRTSLLQEVVDDVIEPALLDYDGELTVSGTPGPVKAGYFHDIDVGPKRGAWEHFFWTLLDNPFLEAKSGKPPAQILAELRERRGWTEDHPTYVREYCGEWVNDQDALVFKYDADRNDFAALPDGRMTYVMGVDLGFEDADAIAVLGWGPHDPTVYLVEEHVERKQSVTELADRVKAMYQRYRPIRLVADFGGLGKKIAEEIRRRHSLPVEAADKQRKLEHIALLNDAMLSGRLRARATGQFAEDCTLVQWDQDARATGTLKIAEDYHSDITDAVLYAFRACLGYLTTPEPTPQSHEAAYVARLAAQDRASAHRDPMEAFLGYGDD
jgi:hypothetical protein